MPLTHWACPPEKPTFGQAHLPEFCITSCEDKCASPFLIAALTASERSNHHQGKYVSATSLSSCPRQLQAERGVNYASLMKNAYYGYRGTVMHQVVEDAASLDMGALQVLAGGNPTKVSTLEEAGYISEWRMSVGFCLNHGGFRLPREVDIFDEATWVAAICPVCVAQSIHPDYWEVMLLGGTLDGLEPLWHNFNPEDGILHCRLWDLKTMQAYAVGYFIKGDKKNTYHPHVKDSHYEQAQLYRYMAEMSEPPASLQALGVRHLKLVDANIQVFAMNLFPRTGTKIRYKASSKSAEVDYQVPSIQFESDEWVEKYIKERGTPIYRALILGQERGRLIEPERSSKGSHSWLCDFCAFHKTIYCPDPAAEWKLLEEEMPEEEAFARVYNETFNQPRG